MQILIAVKKLLDMKTTSNFAECIQVARGIFNTSFDFNIRDLLGVFPADHINE
jgi:ubiquitin-activating enzyme E1